MSQVNRIDTQKLESAKILRFTFDGKTFEGLSGDTLASALLANGQKLIGRSFKYHRPRGIFSAGPEEPNALVQVHQGTDEEPNTRATEVELYDGLKASSQNYKGSLKRDWMALSDFLSPLLPAGFYYKTFMWPSSFWEKVYEPAIRASAGLGMLSGREDSGTYGKGFLHCDILIIGAGPSGISAALAACRSGARVILADEGFELGGRLISETFSVDGLRGIEWVKKVVSELESMKNLRLMTRTTIFGAYDHGTYGAVERMAPNHLTSSGQPQQILWKIYSKRAILCSGATERAIAFGNNDRPGIMLASAVRTYVNRWGVSPGKQVAVFTNNDDGWRTAADLSSQGVEITAIVDTRENPKQTSAYNTNIITNGRIIDTQGRLGIRSFTLSTGKKIEADCLAVSGGWNPNIHLTCHHGGRPSWREDIGAFIPGNSLPTGMSVAGAANGILTLAAVVNDGHSAGLTAADELDFGAPNSKPPKAEDEDQEIEVFWHVKETTKRAWIDLQNDVTTKDVEIAHREGFKSVEHLKRYTTLGMATDQGKTANVLGIGVLAECSGKSIKETGTTTFRPPYTAVSIGAFAGHSRGKHFKPSRLTPSHNWALEQGATFVEAGLWLRPQWFAQPGETHWRQHVDREVLNTRGSVGVCDVTTLGKIDVQGRDAAAFLNKVYVNGFAKLPIGKTRYGLMLREDGIAMDDGTTARLSDTHFLMTTTTANAVNVFRHMEFCRQCLWPEMDVHLISVTEQFAQFAVAGPNSRKLLNKLVDDEHDISNDAFPYMACGEITVCGGTPARLFRISFSGELAYELAVPSRYGDSLIRKLMEAGEEFNVTAYGTEALGVMRIEKGHAAGSELNGQTTARDLGMEKMTSKSKDYIGKILAERPGLNKEDGLSLMGFQPVNPNETITAGSHLFSKHKTITTANDEGWLSSVAYSPTLGHSIGLGFIMRGADRENEIVRAVNLLQRNEIEVRVVSPHFVDPKGDRLRV